MRVGRGLIVLSSVHGSGWIKKVCVSVCMCVYVCAYVCVCEREREREMVWRVSEPITGHWVDDYVNSEIKY